MGNRDHAPSNAPIVLPSEGKSLPTAVSRLIHRIQKGKKLSADYRETLNAIATATKRTPAETIRWIKSWTPEERRGVLATLAGALKS